MALKSTEEERALLRARSAVQRFPVVEWRQRMEDFHKRSINTSRHLAGENAWRQSDGEAIHAPQVAHLDHDDWDPVNQAEPSQPNWDTRSMMDAARTSSVSPSPGIPGSPGFVQQDQYLLAAPRSDDNGRRSFDSEAGSTYADDYYSTQRSRAPSTVGTPTEGGFDSFLARANKQIAKDKKHAPDPFLDAENAPPRRPFGHHSRNSSRDSIASIVDEKASSPLNKAIASVCYIFFSNGRLGLINYFYSLLMRMAKLLKSLFKSFRISRLITQRVIYRSNVTCKRVKKHSSRK